MCFHVEVKNMNFIFTHTESRIFVSTFCLSAAITYFSVSLSILWSFSSNEFMQKATGQEKMNVSAPAFLSIIMH